MHIHACTDCIIPVKRGHTAGCDPSNSYNDFIVLGDFWSQSVNEFFSKSFCIFALGGQG